MALVVIDPGHGGANPGAVYNGRQEKDDVLALSLAVGNILEQNGVDVYQISKFLGHKSIAATEKTYAEYLPSDMKKTLRDKLQFDLPMIETE